MQGKSDMEAKIIHGDNRADGRLRKAAAQAIEHVTELRDAWMRGAIRECDGQGGTRSNRNVDVEVALRKALEDAPPAAERRPAVDDTGAGSAGGAT
jgi:hypothetical protein